MAVGNPAMKSAAVRPPQADRQAGCHLLFARQSEGEERVPASTWPLLKSTAHP